MESEAETQVIITDATNSIIDHSNSISPSIKPIIQSVDHTIVKDGIIEGDWGKVPYSTVSPVTIKGVSVGYVYMFLDTEGIQL